jgi:hypothetical protein
MLEHACFGMRKTTVSDPHSPIADKEALLQPTSAQPILGLPNLSAVHKCARLLCKHSAFLVALMIALCMAEPVARATSPGSPWDDVHSISIVVSLGSGANSLPREGEIAEFIANYIRVNLDKPASGAEHARPDVPLKVIEQLDYYASFTADFDLVFLWKFAIDPATSGGGIPLVSYSVFGDFFGSDQGVLTRTGTDFAAIGAWISSEGKEGFFDNLSQLLKKELADPISDIRRDRYRDLGKMGQHSAGAHQRLFTEVHHVGVVDSSAGGTRNPILLQYSDDDNEAVWLARVFVGELAKEDVALGHSRPDIIVRPHLGPVEGRRRLKLYIRTSDVDGECGKPQCTLETLTIAFSGPGYETLLSFPESFVVAPTRQEYREQFEVIAARLLSSITEQLRKTM